MILSPNMLARSPVENELQGRMFGTLAIAICLI